MKFNIIMKARIKGTNIFVDCLDIGISPTNTKGIECKYLNGEHKDAHDVIPGDCLIECDEREDYKKLHQQAAIGAMQSLLANEVYFKRLCDFFNCGDSPSYKLIEQVNYQAIKVADDLIEELKKKEYK